MNLLKALLVTLSLLVLTACGGGSSEDDEPVVILAFGDSLTANDAVFVTPSEHWIERLKAAITKEKLNVSRSVTVINEGIGGENSQDALDRLPGVLARYKPTHVILLHGTNDISPFSPESANDITAVYLEAMANVAKDAGVKEVIMAEFNLRAYGEFISNAYTVAYQKAARNTDSAYVHMTEGIPFDGVNYFPDGIHFTNGAQEALKNNLVSVLFPMLR